MKAKMLPVFLLLSFFLFSPSSFALSTETTIYFSSIEKNIESGEVKVYYGAGNGSIVRTINNGTSTISYLHPDHLGSTVLITKPDKTRETSISYYPYGKETTIIPFSKTDKLYTNQRKDFSSDLYFYNARYYNPKTGHFISGDKAQGGNRYSYVSNNPIMKNDPSGNMDQISGGGVYGEGSFAGALASTVRQNPEQWVDAKIGIGLVLGGIQGGSTLIGAGHSAIESALPYLYLAYTSSTQFLGKSVVQNIFKGADLVTTALCGALGVGCNLNTGVNVAQSMPYARSNLSFAEGASYARGGGTYKGKGGEQLVIDLVNDIPLRRYLSDLRRTVLARRTSLHISRAALVTQYVDETITFSSEEENAIYARNGGRATLGEFVSCGIGVCREMAALTHLGLAEVEVKSKMVTADIDGGRHAWVEYKDSVTNRTYVADPVSQLYGVPQSEAYQEYGFVKNVKRKAFVKP